MVRGVNKYQVNTKGCETVGSGTINIPPVFWAKYSAPKPGQSATWLPLWAHCLDVAMVFRALCDLPAVARALSRNALQNLTRDSLDQLAFLAGMHDIGKANLGFQLKVLNPKAPQGGHVRELAPILDPDTSDDLLRERFLGILPPGMEEWFTSDEVAYSYFMMAFSHHGRPLRFAGERGGSFSLARDIWWQPHYGLDPFQALQHVMEWLTRALPGSVPPFASVLPNRARFHHQVAGLIMLADWLGSHQDWFPIKMVGFDDRFAHNRQAIPHLLRAVGLDPSPLRSALTQSLRSFEARFGFAPRPVQQAISALPIDSAGSELSIVESDTGSGKTEAVLEWFFRLFEAGKVDSLYFALPTRVAARELHQRVAAIMDRWFSDQSVRPVTVLAVPGYPEPSLPRKATLPRPDRNLLWSDDVSQRAIDTRFWAAERPKRYLAATVAVGTIDQALLSIVQTAHAHLRSVCLDRALLVVDEVHASDVYATRLLEALVHHHQEAGGYTTLLSATLGSSARSRFVSGGSAGVHSLAASCNVPYPLITLGTGAEVKTTRALSTKRVRFETAPAFWTPNDVMDAIIQALSRGARVLVILNTVRRAVGLFQMLESRIGASMFQCQGVATPHHGRFAPADRVLLDQGVSRRFGASGDPGPVLLIGTQTLEQSLDIDADFLVTDLCPADVLLQRVGRLHRHAKLRPEGCEEARCVVLVPHGDLEEYLDNRGFVSPRMRKEGLGSVYPDLRILELTRRLLEKEVFSFPQDNRWFVEHAVHPEALSILDGTRWVAHGQQVDGEALAKVIAAGSVVATYDEYFGQFAFAESGDRIATRLGLDSLQLPLESPIVSPFGAEIHDMVIPGHLRPREPDEMMVIEDARPPLEWSFRCGDRRYRYSRVGLEVLSE